MKISVIVPVYNAERYLDKLVQSVLSQTYEDYELILVDDSSKDNSYLLMKKYQEMDSRIKAYIAPSRAEITIAVSTGTGR